MLSTLIKEARVLYIEDDVSISNMIRDNLGRLCKKFYLAYDGEEGLKVFKEYQNDIDIIITDLNMPRLNGIDMIHEIRDIDYDIPIIINSAFGDEVMLKRAINLGVDGFVAKPLILQDLIKIMGRTLKPVFYKKELQKKDALIFQQSKLAAIGEMIGNIAHQWRQPLNSIGVTMMKLELKSESGDLTKEIVSDIITNTNSIIAHMSKTIDDFRNFFSPNKSKDIFLIRDNIQSILSLMIPQLHNHGIEIEVSGDQDIEVYGYENELKQVLINIVSNAKDAIINNKSVDNGLIKIDIVTKNHNLVLSISDNAGGVPQDIINRIFEPYFTTKFKSQGTGLGLYMSKVIIEKNMKGMLSIENDEFGAIFSITIPLRESRDGYSNN